MALVSASVLREYLPEIGSSTGADSELTSLIERVETSIARYLGFPPPITTTENPTLDQSTYTLYLDGPMYTDRSVLQLPVKPIASITSIHSDPDRKYESSSLLTLSNIDIDNVNGKLIIKPTTSTTFDRGFRAIKITFVGGFTDSPPLDLIHAICVWCSQLHRQKQTQGKDQISVQGASVRLSLKSMPREVRELLNRFRTSFMVL